MSSPGSNPTSIWICISSPTIPDYIPASPTKNVPASPEKIYSSSSNNSICKISLAHFKIANLEKIIKDIQVRHQADKESLLDAIYEHKNSQEGPSDY
ncbi:hypothetical protein Tco_1253355 [Tanacetum coccineum]